MIVVRGASKGSKTIPNKDFVLRYKVSGQIGTPYWRTEREGIFMIRHQPPERVALKISCRKNWFCAGHLGFDGGHPLQQARRQDWHSAIFILMTLSI